MAGRYTWHWLPFNTAPVILVHGAGWVGVNGVVNVIVAVSDSGTQVARPVPEGTGKSGEGNPVSSYTTVGSPRAVSPKHSIPLRTSGGVKEAYCGPLELHPPQEPAMSSSIIDPFKVHLRTSTRHPRLTHWTQKLIFVVISDSSRRGGWLENLARYSGSNRYHVHPLRLEKLSHRVWHTKCSWNCQYKSAKSGIWWVPCKHIANLDRFRKRGMLTAKYPYRQDEPGNNSQQHNQRYSISPHSRLRLFIGLELRFICESARFNDLLVLGITSQRFQIGH